MVAIYYQQAGDQANAKKLMSAALKAAPDDLNTQLVAAQLAMENGQLEDAQNRAVAALRINPSSQDAKKVRGVAALFQKDYKAAEINFESAHLKDPDDFAAKNNLALALVEQKDESKKRKRTWICQKQLGAISKDEQCDRSRFHVGVGVIQAEPDRRRG